MGAPVAIEATYGWYWAVDALTAAGFEVSLAHPRGIKTMQNRRAKTDALDARELAELLRLDRLAQAWIAPPQIRDLRELVRYRHKLVHDRAAVKASIHAVLGKCGVIPEVGGRLRPGRGEDPGRPGAARAVCVSGRLAAAHPGGVEHRDHRAGGRVRAPVKDTASTGPCSRSTGSVR